MLEIQRENDFSGIVGPLVSIEVVSIRSRERDLCLYTTRVHDDTHVETKRKEETRAFVYLVWWES